MTAIFFAILFAAIVVCSVFMYKHGALLNNGQPATFSNGAKVAGFLVLFFGLLYLVSTSFLTGAPLDPALLH